MKKYLPYAINAVIAGVVAYGVVETIRPETKFVWYNPTTWF